MKSYTFGGIDIGSNAMRLLITQVYNYKSHTKFRKISYSRFPLRLGLDVFDTGIISAQKKELLIKTLKAYKLLLEVHGADDYKVFATSAMRDAVNGSKIIKEIFDEIGIDIDIISGKEEADIIYSKELIRKLGSGKNCIYVDIGGGSTEISIFANHEKIDSKSFKIGTLRLMLNKVDNQQWQEMNNWLEQARAKYNFKFCIGTGGNINKVSKLLKHKVHTHHFYDLKDIEQLQEKLEKMTFEERIIKYKLKPDRSDVIVHALEIFTSIMRKMDIDQMHVPRIGLADGMIRDMYNQKVKELV